MSSVPARTVGGDPTTSADAEAILQKYRIRLPLTETPKPGDPALARVQNLIIGSNRMAIDAGAKQAKSLGYRPLVLSTFIQGETRDIAQMHAAIVKEILSSGRPVKPPVCVLSGGETTVTVRGTGLGGRNQGNSSSPPPPWRSMAFAPPTIFSARGHRRDRRPYQRRGSHRRRLDPRSQPRPRGSIRRRTWKQTMTPITSLNRFEALIEKAPAPREPT